MKQFVIIDFETGEVLIEMKSKHITSIVYLKI